jgi:serine phosphatase RsbU (regulator of sigma subunit)
MLDAAERVGVIGAVDDGALPLEAWTDFASLVGELVVAKEAYGDAIAVARRTAAVSLAAEMRWSLLPPLTFSSTVVSVSGILQPSHVIAGDAFDYAVERETASVAILDAMGHGLEASRMANLAVGAYRNARRRDATPAETLVEMDAVITSEFGEARFVTAQVASLEIGSGRVTVLTAGHPAPILLSRRHGPSTVAVAHHRPLGLGYRPGTAATVQLDPGDALLLHSDGVAEARSPAGDVFGEERIAATAARLLDAGLKAPEVLRQVIRSAIDFQGGRVRDDATLVLLRWRPAAVGAGEPPEP